VVNRRRDPSLRLVDGYRPLPVAYQLRAAILQRVRRGEDPLPDIQGREETKRDVLRALLSGYNIYLVSEEGTGKTRLAKALTRLLPPIPRIRGCPYNDDPEWPIERLCPKCREIRSSLRPPDIEIIPGRRRFSRIQGNDYTDEAKLLGLKDIQAIVKGESPADIRAFAATGAFRANRGILFIDELPAIRTKVQVLLHPIAEEKKAILEEYNWEHPLDIIIVATGNPRGFSHINEVPRPLLDRLELIYMPLPDKDTEQEIMLQERFRIRDDCYGGSSDLGEAGDIPHIDPRDIQRQVFLPWWILHLLIEALDYSRRCSLLDRRPSIRASYRALDHTYASTELANRRVSRLEDACQGLKLALRGRIELRPDLTDFDNPVRTFSRIDELSEDLLFNAFENSKDRFLHDCDRDRLAGEIRTMKALPLSQVLSRLPEYREISRAIQRLERSGNEKIDQELVRGREDLTPEHRQQYDWSALEIIINSALHKGWIEADEVPAGLFVPRMVSWAAGTGRG